VVSARQRRRGLLLETTVENSFNFFGHDVAARTLAAPDGRWLWEYTIDGVARKLSPDKPLPLEQLALLEACVAAQEQIRQEAAEH